MKSKYADALIELANKLDNEFTGDTELPYKKDDFIKWLKKYIKRPLLRLIFVVRLSKAPNTDLFATKEDCAFGNFFGLDKNGPYLALEYAFMCKRYDLIEQILKGVEDLINTSLIEVDPNSSDYIHLHNWKTIWNLYEKFINHRVDLLKTNKLETASNTYRSQKYFDERKKEISDVLMNLFRYDDEYPIDLCDALFEASNYISYNLSKEFMDKLNHAIELACNEGCMDIIDLYFKQIGTMLPTNQELKKINGEIKIIAPFLREVLSELYRIVLDRAQTVVKEKYTVFCTRNLFKQDEEQDEEQELFQTLKGRKFRDLIDIEGDFNLKDLNVIVSNPKTIIWEGREADNYLMGDPLEYAINSSLRFADAMEPSLEPFTSYVVVIVPDDSQDFDLIYKKVRTHFAKDSFVQIAFFMDEDASNISISVVRCKFYDNFIRKWD